MSIRTSIAKVVLRNVVKNAPPMVSARANTLIERAESGTARDVGAVWNAAVDFIRYLITPRLWSSKDTYDEYMGDIRSMSDAGAISLCRYNYTSDKRPEDSWQTPPVTYERTDILGRFTGDCEDLATFLAVGLTRSNHDVFILTMHPVDGVGHATCAVRGKDGLYSTVCTFFRIDHYTDDPVEVAKYWYKHGDVNVYRYDPTDFTLMRVERYLF